MHISAHAAGMHFVLKGIQFNALGQQPFALHFNPICFLQMNGSIHFVSSLEWALFLRLGFLMSSVQKHHEATFIWGPTGSPGTPQKSANPPKALTIYSSLFIYSSHLTIYSLGYIQVKTSWMHTHDYNMLFFFLCLFSLSPNTLSLWRYIQLISFF